MESQDAVDVWFDLDHPSSIDESHARQTVLHRPFVKGPQNLCFVIIECDDELAALEKGQPTLRTERLQHSSARSAQ